MYYVWFLVDADITAGNWTQLLDSNFNLSNVHSWKGGECHAYEYYVRYDGMGGRQPLITPNGTNLNYDG